MFNKMGGMDLLSSSPSAARQRRGLASQLSLQGLIDRRNQANEKSLAYERRHHPLKKRLTIIVSGCIMSGKTTLAHILVGLFSNPSLEGSYGGNTSTKVFLLKQENYRIPCDLCPLVEWIDNYPAVYAGDHPEDLDLNESYWAAAFEANIGLDPALLERTDDARAPDEYSPMPRISVVTGHNIDCRMSIDWPKFLSEVEHGMTAATDDDKGMMSTESGAQIVKDYMNLLDEISIASLKNNIMKFVDEQHSKNLECGFKGRAVVDGVLRDIFIMEGPLLCILGPGTEKIMDFCDMKIFLPTSKDVAMRRRLGRLGESSSVPTGYPDGATGTTEGYFDDIAWPEYTREHEWLTSDGNLERPTAIPSPFSWQKSVTVRPELDSPLLNTVRFAVEMILAKLAVEEEIARAEHRGELKANGSPDVGASTTNHRSLFPPLTSDELSAPFRGLESSKPAPAEPSTIIVRRPGFQNPAEIYKATGAGCHPSPSSSGISSASTKSQRLGPINLKRVSGEPSIPNIRPMRKQTPYVPPPLLKPSPMTDPTKCVNAGGHLDKTSTLDPRKFRRKAPLAVDTDEDDEDEDEMQVRKAVPSRQESSVRQAVLGPYVSPYYQYPGTQATAPRPINKVLNTSLPDILGPQWSASRQQSDRHSVTPRNQLGHEKQVQPARMRAIVNPRPPEQESYPIAPLRRTGLTLPEALHMRNGDRG